MWILGLILLAVIFGLRGFIKIFIGYLIIAYILYLIAMFAPSLIGLLVIGLFIKYILF